MSNSVEKVGLAGQAYVKISGVEYHSGQTVNFNINTSADQQEVSYHKIFNGKQVIVTGISMTGSFDYYPCAGMTIDVLNGSTQPLEARVYSGGHYFSGTCILTGNDVQLNDVNTGYAAGTISFTVDTSKAYTWATSGGG